MEDINYMDFQDIVRQEMEQLPRGDRSDSKQLLIWALTRMYDIDYSFAETIICDGTQDKGIDALFVDDELEQILIFQSKFKVNNDRSFGDSDLQRLRGSREYFASPISVQELLDSNANNELKSLIEEFKIKDKVDSYNVEMHFISNAFATNEAKEYAQVIPDLVLCDIKFMESRYQYIKDEDLVFDRSTFENIDIDNLIKINFDTESDVQSIITSIPALDLLKLSGLDDLTLFNKNVRYGLGNTRVNKSIRGTINNVNERKNFILFHNGISIVSEQMLLDEETKELTIENYSVVNGAQSIITFKEEQNNLTSDIEVIVKFSTVGTNSSLMQLISKYNNNQNAISMKDLRSSDQVQVRLNREFENLDNQYNLGYFYQIKRGDPRSDGKIIIDNGYAAQLILSGVLYKSYNTHLKASLFDARYSDVFSRNTSASQIARLVHIHDSVLLNLDEFSNKGVAEYGLTQHFVISVISYIYSNESEIFSRWSDDNLYFNNIDNWKEMTNFVAKLIILRLNADINILEKRPEFNYKNYFKNRQQVEELHQNQVANFQMTLMVYKMDINMLLTNHNLIQV